MKYNIVNLILKTDSKLTASPAKIRGFLGNTYKDYPILHNHYANDKFNDIGKIFMPLFDELKIDLVLTGHLHTYRNRGKIFDFKKSAEGTTYILCGRAGDQKYLEPNSEIDDVTLPNADKIFEPETFLTVDVEEKFLTLTCYGIGGEIFDKFTIEKV